MGGEKAAGPRYRHDGMTAERRGKLIAALAKYGCVADACHAAGISTTTYYRHRKKWPDFRADCAAAMMRASVPLEGIAWKRAVEGREERTYRGGELVEVKVKPSDSMLRLLLEASNPRKFGWRARRGGETKKQMEKRLRKEIEKEMRAKIVREQVATNEEVEAALVKRLQAFAMRVRAKDEAARREAEGES